MKRSALRYLFIMMSLCFFNICPTKKKVSKIKIETQEDFLAFIAAHNRPPLLKYESSMPDWLQQFGGLLFLYYVRMRGYSISLYKKMLLYGKRVVARGKRVLYTYVL